MAKSSLKKRTVKPTSTDEDFGKKQLFMHKSKDKSMVVLSSGNHDEQGLFIGTIVHDNEQLNIGIVTEFQKSDYLPVNGQFKVILK
jgi:hypothetical protein